MIAKHWSPSVLLGAFLLLAIAPVAQPVSAQDDIIAFGDSITLGPPPFDEEDLGGYPARLEDLLDAAGESLRVFNEGVSGEDTAEGLSRIDGVLSARAERAGLVILMEGTNDVTFISRGERSIETTVQNLEAMANKVRAQDLEVLYSTVIPRPSWARWDRDNTVTQAFTVRLRDLTSGGGREMADPFEVFENQGAPGFRTYYFCCDPVGHPNADGFDLMAQLFADKLLGDDTLPPTISVFSKSGNPNFLQAGDNILAVVHESGTGIEESETFFTVNGRTVNTQKAGGRRRLELTYNVASRDIECAGRISVRTEDRATPPNQRNRIVAELSVANAVLLRGDANGDCTVDGFDLGLMGIAFGSRFGEINYSALADTNNDDRIDGDDLARLARNFGKQSG